ncbi:hypothetical protein SVAN01_03045 [Stagonosporopsis vannaccii]|nr:hypothetical protein SVAN01_03045 [Stagonosporopsis vannaccii]
MLLLAARTWQPRRRLHFLWGIDSAIYRVLEIGDEGRAHRCAGSSFIIVQHSLLLKYCVKFEEAEAHLRNGAGCVPALATPHTEKEGAPAPRSVAWRHWAYDAQWEVGIRDSTVHTDCTAGECRMRLRFVHAQLVSQHFNGSFVPLCDDKECIVNEASTSLGPAPQCSWVFWLRLQRLNVIMVSTSCMMPKMRRCDLVTSPHTPQICARELSPHSSFALVVWHSHISYHLFTRPWI